MVCELVPSQHTLTRLSLPLAGPGSSPGYCGQGERAAAHACHLPCRSDDADLYSSRHACAAAAAARGRLERAACYHTSRVCTFLVSVEQTHTSQTSTAAYKPPSLCRAFAALSMRTTSLLNHAAQRSTNHAPQPRTVRPPRAPRTGAGAARAASAVEVAGAAQSVGEAGEEGVAAGREPRLLTQSVPAEAPQCTSGAAP